MSNPSICTVSHAIVHPCSLETVSSDHRLESPLEPRDDNSRGGDRDESDCGIDVYDDDTIAFENDDICLSPRYFGERNAVGDRTGPGSLLYGDGSRVDGCFIDDKLEGDVCEYAQDGKLLYQGQYEDDLRHGRGRLFMEGGAVLEGAWFDGLADSDHMVFRFEDGSSYMGVWRDDHMSEAQFVPASSFDESRAISASSIVVVSPLKYAYTPSNHILPGATPLLADPYEALRVCVAASTIKDADEGLFACRSLPRGEIVAFYNGVRRPTSEVDSASWHSNRNLISLSASEAIDLPEPFDQIIFYCATLGHKTNHSFLPNCRFDGCWHPRHGQIKCLRTLYEVSEGSELTVDYGYGESVCPGWFRAARKAFRSIQDS